MLALLAVVPLFAVAIALGPIIVTVLFAVGCGLVVAVLVNLVIALGFSIERAGSHALHRHRG
jgi:hypothetical protein